MKGQLLHKYHIHYEKKNACKIRFKKTSYSQIRRTRVPNLGRWLIYKESSKNCYKMPPPPKKIQIQRIQTKNKTVFIPNKVPKQNLPPYQHKVCAPIWNISHIISRLLHGGLKTNDQYRTHRQRLTEICWWRRRKFFNHSLPGFAVLLQKWFLIPFLTTSW